MADPDTWHGLKENPYRWANAAANTTVYGPIIQQALDDSWTAEQFGAHLGATRRPLTLRQRIKRWWARNRPVLHRGPCNHDDCY